jgi:hypothetical protein
MVPPPWQLVFVDAGLPPISGDATLVPDQFLGALRALAHDGVLPKWSEWFGPTAMEELISNEEHRAAVVAELPEVPLSYFEAAVPLPGRWSSATIGAFLLLSEPYRSRPRRGVRHVRHTASESGAALPAGLARPTVHMIRRDGRRGGQHAAGSALGHPPSTPQASTLPIRGRPPP